MMGISPDALRIWERRYAAVSPQRSPGGGRRYSLQDVARLRLMKQLVDAGHAMGEVATLDLDTLQDRTAEAQRLPSAPRVLTEAEGCHVSLLGESLAREIQAAGDTLTGITPVDQCADIADFEARAGGHRGRRDHADCTAAAVRRPNAVAVGRAFFNGQMRMPQASRRADRQSLRLRALQCRVRKPQSPRCGTAGLSARDCLTGAK